MGAKKLNAGCGRDIRAGWVNLDATALPGVDVVHDLERLPLPFGDAEFSAILCRDVLEHLDYVPLMREFHRILEPGGTLRVRVPHFTSENNFADPTHRRFFSARTFAFFVKGSPLRQDHLFDYAFDRVASVRITFARGVLFFNRVVEPLVNARDATRHLFEGTFLSRLFPAENVIVELVK